MNTDLYLTIAVAACFAPEIYYCIRNAPIMIKTITGNFGGGLENRIEQFADTIDP